ncbi:MAG: hypothetical protein ACUVTL_06160 [Thermoproteota archaeon]
MKKETAFATIMLVWLVLASAACWVGLAKAEEYTVSTKRVVVLHEGYIVVNDTFVLVSSGKLPQEFMLGNPKSFSQHTIRSYIYPYAVSSAGEVLMVEWSDVRDDKFDWLSVKLPSASGRIEFSVVQAFSNMATVTLYGDRVLILPAVPVLKTETNYSYTEVWFDKWWEVNLPSENYTKKEVGNSIVYFNSYGKLPAESNLTARFIVTSLKKEQYLVTEVSKAIDLNPFSGLTVTEGVKFMVETYSGATSVQFFIFGNVSDVSVRDDIGDFLPESVSTMKRSTFKVSKPANSSMTLISIFPRYPIYPMQNFSLQISYRIPAQNITGLSAFGGSVSLSLPKTTNFTSFANNFILEVVLPTGARFGDVKIGRFGLSNELNETNSFRAVIEGATEEIFDSSITIAYRYDTFWAGYSPSIFAGIVFLAGLAYILTRKRKITEVTVTPIEFESVRRFVERYRERLRIEESLERIQENLKNNRITRQEYKARSRSLMLKLEEINRTLPQLKSQAAKANRRVADLIEGIEVSEAEIKSMNSAIRDLNMQLSQRRISRAAHEKLIDNYAKRVRGEKTKIGAALNELDILARV